MEMRTKFSALNVDFDGLSLDFLDLDRRNLCSMLQISCAACLCLSQLVLAQFTLEKCLVAQNRQKIHKTPCLSV